VASTARPRTSHSPRSRRRLAALFAFLYGAAPALAQRADSLALPPGLTADSALLSSLRVHVAARERSDTVRSFPVRRLGDGVYAVIGDTGRGSEGRSNAGFIVTGDGVVVVDALASPAQGEVLRRTISTVTSQPVRWVILTHHHPDHHFGAIVFKRQGAIVLAHPDRRTLASENGEDQLVSDWTGVLGLREMQGFEFADRPDIPLSRDTTLHFGGHMVQIVVPSGPHTAGDLMVWMPVERVLFSGDILVEDGVTLMVDGSSAALMAALNDIDVLSPKQVVPGHGRIPSNPRALVELTRCYVVGLRARMRVAVESGMRMSRTLATFPPPDRDRPVSLKSRLRRNGERVYLELERNEMRAGLGGAGGAGGSGPSAAERAQLAQCGP
jgi:glyoxylase-like metal-dependent hydrolase (beta-lactamase superfamily II)